MKSNKTIIIASGLLVVLAVVIGLIDENDPRGHAAFINTSGFFVEKPYKAERCVVCPATHESIDNFQENAGLEKIYLLAFHFAALFGLSNEKTSRDQAVPVSSPGFAVVELFTSEGCNTCPPADELVKNIQRDERTGKVYILAFHVDYWDHQGWKDQFSEKEFTNRQIQYASWLRLQTIYTPQIVVNGTSEHVGSDKRSVLKAISTGMSLEAPHNLTLNARVEGDQIHVEYQVNDDKNSELVLVLIQRESAQVDIMAGENEGRSLSHVQIVRRMSRLPLSANNRRITAIKPPIDFMKKGWEIIGFVQNTSSGGITSAARVDIE